MVYQFNRGMVVPFTKRFWKVIVLAFAGLFIFTQFMLLLQKTRAATSNIVVTPGDMATAPGDLSSNPNAWFFYNDENDTIDNSLGSFVSGPSTPPAGEDSVQISVSGTQRRNLATYQFAGTALSDITQLKYSTYNPSAGNGGSANRSGYLNFNIDFDGSDTWQKRLVFLPSDNGSIQQNTWQEWDAVNGGNALYRYSGTTWPGTATSGTTPRTLSDLTSSYPGIRIRVSDPWLGIRVGEPYNDGYTENIDKFVFGNSDETKVFDFETENRIPPCQQGSGYATSVSVYQPGTKKGGGAITGERGNPDNALGAPNATTNPDGGFYSLGVEGSITVMFNGYVTNQQGVDLSFHEVTNGRSSYPEEKIDVQVSQNGTDWFPIGSVTNKDASDGVSYLDFDSTGLDWIQYVKISDSTNYNLHVTGADGYDLDAVDATNIVCEEPQPTPEATLVANKIVCDDESDLPNWGGGGPDITSASFASDWVGQHPGCTLADNWSFEYKSHGDQSNPGGNTIGPKGGDWQTFTASGQTASVNVPLDNVSLIQTREVLPEGYIPFTDNSDNVSAEFYCHTDVANYDNWEWIQNPQDGATYYCVAWNVKKPVNVLASKIVCDDESRLPNWGNGQTGPAAIDANTADDWLAQGDNGQHCHKVDWNFQWKMDPTSNPGDNTGAAGDGWQTFNSGSGVSISSAQQGNSHTIWVREVWNDDYIPFTGQNTTQDVSAELYCGDDILNYDNWDFISNVQPGETYHCVAWNVQKPKEFKVKADKVICDSEQYLPNWGEGGQNIKKKTAKNYVKQSDGHCWLDPEWNFQWSPDNVGNPGDNLGEQTSPWTTFNGTVTLPVSAVGDGNKVWFREVANDNYIPFSGTPANDPYSAEFYCHNDVLNYDNWDWIATPKAGKKYYCVGFNVLKPATLSATKIVCNTESVLPGWGTGQGNVGVIDANTAANWLAESDHDEFCHLENWDFEWVADKSSSSNPGDETPLAGAPWKVFNTNDPQGASVDIAPLGDNHKIWVRESFNPSYIGFTGQTTQEGENGSAEIYCNDDILNFDNWEYIDNVQPGAHYYCVAWNVPINGQISGLVYNDKDNNAQQDDGEPGIQGATVWLLTHNSPWTVKGITTTASGGDYLFQNLTVPGTYYVCQDVQDGWFQTQLNKAGLVGLDISNVNINDVIGDTDDAALDEVIDNFCYKVELTADNPVAGQKDFGNYNTQDQTGVLGESTEKDPPSSSNGQVLGASTDAELADTGETTIPSLFIGLIGVGLTFAVAYASKTRNKKFKLNR